MSSIEFRTDPPLPLRGPGCPPILRLEELVSGEHPENDASHVAECGDCGAYVQALKKRSQTFRSNYPRAPFLRQVRRRAAQARTGVSAPWLVLALAAGLTAIVLAEVSPPRRSAEPFGGKPFGALYLRAGMQRPQPVRDGMLLHPGDTLRFVFTAPAPGHLAILQLDARGRASVLHPRSGPDAQPIDGHPQPLSTVLDESVGPEKLVAVYARTRLKLAPLLASLAAQADAPSLRLDCDGCEVQVLRIEKANAP